MTAELGPVLYAEDSEDEAFLMERAFRQSQFEGALVVVRHGLEAIAYLGRDGPFAEAAVTPSLVLLDVKMPRLGGVEVLRWIRARAAFQALPVIMLTSSSQESDVAAAYAHGADAYVLKPTGLDAFQALVLALIALLRGEGVPSPLLRLPGRLGPPSKPPL